jgi:hypothetical protein
MREITDYEAQNIIDLSKASEALYKKIKRKIETAEVPESHAGSSQTIGAYLNSLVAKDIGLLKEYQKHLMKYV